MLSWDEKEKKKDLELSTRYSLNICKRTFVFLRRLQIVYFRSITKISCHLRTHTATSTLGYISLDITRIFVRVKIGELSERYEKTTKESIRINIKSDFDIIWSSTLLAIDQYGRKQSTVPFCKRRLFPF